ncbi:heavy-metal-associated domain-containing protein [Gluconacetobacter sacchari]|uniref:Heavy-metal-associated domain-containing protein n=2 Tax=Gluconacetobacter sacchari TaxID=92759 RepID=A0A7W4IGA6_9PROT|nr:cation transporter [Gluconacetobacter sacchari]MBB2162310.1 heavy-metal-associated domain-containing protein [Gluconacetobacter sacchari]GBQ20408.1 cation/copper resistance transporter ATPase CopZ [Gluconacetobacter sacchari DSM 12717]
MVAIENLIVEGMSCGGCSGKLKRALEALDGVSEADVVLEGGKVSVQYDPAVVQASKFAEVVEETGFELVS